MCLEPSYGEIFNSFSQLKAHIKVAHYYVACETCGVSMLKNKLKSHIQTHKRVQTLVRCLHPRRSHMEAVTIFFFSVVTRKCSDGWCPRSFVRRRIMCVTNLTCHSTSDSHHAKTKLHLSDRIAA
uniref:C2H2-type domain-containing protein n=1 Tax=Physcomitrium patens TaxID=3218 RepID=A0A2K1JZZ0_PHYPA|nr:hypothetical protein PHYPA_014213 [Physcomitrium patens]